MSAGNPEDALFTWTPKNSQVKKIALSVKNNPIYYILSFTAFNMLLSLASAVWGPSVFLSLIYDLSICILGVTFIRNVQVISVDSATLKVGASDVTVVRNKK